MGSRWIQYQCFKCGETWFEDMRDENTVQHPDMAGVVNGLGDELEERVW
jgi:hypothetical protein